MDCRVYIAYTVATRQITNPFVYSHLLYFLILLLYFFTYGTSSYYFSSFLSVCFCSFYFLFFHFDIRLLYTRTRTRTRSLVFLIRSSGLIFPRHDYGMNRNRLSVGRSVGRCTWNGSSVCFELWCGEVWHFILAG